MNCKNKKIKFLDEIEEQIKEKPLLRIEGPYDKPPGCSLIESRAHLYRIVSKGFLKQYTLSVDIFNCSIILLDKKNCCSIQKNQDPYFFISSDFVGYTTLSICQKQDNHFIVQACALFYQFLPELVSHVLWELRGAVKRSTKKEWIVYNCFCPPDTVLVQVIKKILSISFFPFNLQKKVLERSVSQ